VVGYCVDLQTVRSRTTWGRSGSHVESAIEAAFPSVSLAPGQRVDLVSHAAPLVEAFVDRRVVVDASVDARYGRLVHRLGQARERARREAVGVVRVVRVADIAPERDQRFDLGAVSA